MTLCLAAELLKGKPNLDILNEEIFNSILCVSAYLYNAAIRYLYLDLQKYSQIYQADLLNCLNVIYDFS